MIDTREEFTLSALEEARRLWRGALTAFQAPDAGLATLCESLDLGLRTAEILVVERLQPIKGDFPATIGLLLELPDAEVDLRQDALGGRRTLQFNEALDFLSEESLDCVGPQLHRGWEDRTFACRRSRTKAQTAIGITLDAAEREKLLTLAAYRNRIFRTPPPVQINVRKIRDAFPALVALVEKLLGE